MAKSKSVFVCRECGYESSGWLGRCPSCGSWNSLIEERTTSVSPAAREGRSWLRDGETTLPRSLPLAKVSGKETIREPSGISELDRALGGGFVSGSLVLIGGDPGIGKSTLLLQAGAALAEKGKKILYVSGEESPEQIRLRSDRLHLDPQALLLLSASEIPHIEDEIARTSPDFVVIDSIQTMYLPELSSAPGSVTQVRESAGVLLRIAKAQGVTILLVGHVTKEGAIAGPRVLEHMVDTVLYFEGESSGELRLLRCVKNRFGSTDELGLFEMKADGLLPVEHPAMAFLAGRPIRVPGTAVCSVLEGTRPLLLEVQALLTPTAYPSPQRVAQGIDRQRLGMLLAVLQKISKKDPRSYDCYINVAGGIRIRETAADLAVLSAILSSLEDRYLPEDMLLLGEVGLSGEIRSVPYPERRVQDAFRLGFHQFILPSQSELPVSKLALPDSVQIYYVSLLGEAVDLLFHD